MYCKTCNGKGYIKYKTTFFHKSIIYVLLVFADVPIFLLVLEKNDLLAFSIFIPLCIIFIFLLESGILPEIIFYYIFKIRIKSPESNDCVGALPKS